MRILVALCLVTLSALRIYSERPNVLLIMADDLGAEALASYGNTVYTRPLASIAWLQKELVSKMPLLHRSARPLEP